MQRPDPDRSFDYENGFYLTAPVGRISKFVTHLDLYRRVMGLPGAIVECGVFKGASLSRLIKFRALLENPTSRSVVGFDTFGGFPEATLPEDAKQRQAFIDEAGGHSISVEDLRETLAAAGVDDNVELVAGDILKTVPDYVDRHPQLKIALLHIDVDLYEPTRVCLEKLFPLLVRGGIMVLDDYGAFYGANKAIDEYLAEPGVTIEKLPYSNAIAFVQKR